VLKTEQLAFKPIQGNHSGANIGGILMDVIDSYGIREKVRPTSVVHSSLSESYAV